MEGHFKSCTTCGIILGIIANINWTDIVSTVVTTATGVVVSFAMTVLIKRVARKWMTR
jgi:hypothetical protein